MHFISKFSVFKFLIKKNNGIRITKINPINPITPRFTQDSKYWLCKLLKPKVVLAICPELTCQSLNWLYPSLPWPNIGASLIAINAFSHISKRAPKDVSLLLSSK